MTPAVAHLEVVHDTHYRYASPAVAALHLAMLRPIDDATQALERHDLEVEPQPTRRREETDVFGNHRSLFELPAAHAELRVRSTSRLRVAARFDALAPAASPPWEPLADRLRFRVGAAFEPAVEFVQPSPCVPRIDALAAYARPSFPAGRPAAEAAIDLMHRVHADFRYDSGSTQVDTPLAQVIAQKSGVCQDFAHVLCGALRCVGLAARYVSGYLLTRAPGSGAEMVGADASHAWVQAWVPGTPGVGDDGWLDLDPTNALVPGSGHVRVAVGRDYGDVVPLRGVIHGHGGHELAVAVRTRQLPGTAAGDEPRSHGA